MGINSYRCMKVLPMDTSASRRSEDIALDLLKFLATTTNLGRTQTSSTPGFAPANPPRVEDQVQSMLDLYARCRQAVEAPVKP